MKKEIYNVYTYQVYAGIATLIFLPIIVLLYALYYNDIQFFYPFLLIIPLICIPGIALGSVRKVTIDTLSKTVTIYAWFGEKVVIREGTLKSAIQQKDITKIIFQKGDKLVNYDFYSWWYFLYGMRTIIKSLQEFNPDASFQDLERFQ